MIEPPRSRTLAFATVVLAFAVTSVAGIAVFGRGDGSVVTVTSVRGETYPMIVSGVYAFNAQRIVAEGVGWDLFTLFVVVPALLLCAPSVGRGSFFGGAGPAIYSRRSS